MQRITLIGHLGQDCKIVESNGNKFISFSVAVTETYTKNGVKVENTNWFECAYQPQSLAVAEYLKKGKKVYLEGKPKPNCYQSTKTGEWVANIQISVRGVELLSARDQDEATPAVNKPLQQPQMEPASAGGDGEDLPF